jgi:Mg-chelatase subunit ChlD
VPPRYALRCLALGLAPFVAGCSGDEGPAGDRAAGEKGYQGAPILDDSTRRFGDGCVAEVSRAEALPLDLYVLFDQSGSMSTPAGEGSRLAAVRGALSDFLRADESAGMSLGLGYFGNFPLGEASCDPADYDVPAVPIGLLPAHADPLLRSLASIEPTGETPTGAALRGTCDYLAGWRAAHPERTVSVLLLTDGVPEAPISRNNGCDPTLADAIEATRQCVGAGLSVYVLGVGPNLENLDQIAQAGESGAAYLVEGSDVAADVAAALGTIRGTALPCAFEIPPAPEGQSLDFDRVNVVLTRADDSKADVLAVPDAASCDSASGGWYYDPPETRERIQLCDASCRAVRAESSGGAIEFALGCATVELVR